LKIVLYISLILCFFFFGCKKENIVKIASEENTQELDIIDSLENTENTILVMYVNAPGGLSVKNIPSINGDILDLLEDRKEIIVLREEQNIVNIDGINGKWTLIESSDIQGWVFGGYLTKAPRAQEIQELASIREIVETIFDNNPITEKTFYNMSDAAKLFNSFRIVKEWVYQSIHDPTSFTTMYTIEADHYILSIWIPRNSDGSFRIKIDEVFLDVTNYLFLFPHRTMEDFLADDNFGWVYETTENEIRYSDMDPSDCVLKFENGFLYSIKMLRYFGG